MTLYDDQVKALVQYFKSGEKDPDKLKTGVEIEHIVVDEISFRTISIYGEEGICATIQSLEDHGWDIAYEEGYAVGATKGPYTISTEPAGQFEVSIEANSSIEDMEAQYILFIEEMTPIFAGKNQKILGIGYHPVTKIDEITISPKKRYDYMYDHFKTRGSHSHNMMKGTAAVQVVLDYTSEEDFVRKYRIGSALSPIMYTIFENAYIFEGEEAENHGVRQFIWQNTDQSRSGLVKTAFDSDFSYKAYAEYILNTDLIFLNDDKGLRSTEGKLFKDLFDPYDYKEEEIYHAVSIVFPDVRLKKYLEYRMMDSLPYPLNFAPASLWTGLLYKEENLDKLEDMFKDVDLARVEKAKEDTKTLGLEAEYLGKKIYQWGLDLIAMAQDGLEGRAKDLLKPLKDLVEARQSPRDRFKETYKESGLKAAIEETIVEV